MSPLQKYSMSRERTVSFPFAGEIDVLLPVIEIKASTALQL